jgi:hypothetical protein
MITEMSYLQCQHFRGSIFVAFTLIIFYTPDRKITVSTANMKSIISINRPIAGQMLPCLELPEGDGI